MLAKVKGGETAAPEKVKELASAIEQELKQESASKHNKDQIALPARAPARVGFNIQEVTSPVVQKLNSNPSFKLYDEKQQKDWDDKAVSFYTGDGSCSEICGAEGKSCSRDWFLYLDRCETAQAVFPGGRCVDDTHPGVPAFLAAEGALLVGRDPRQDPSTCVARGSAGGTRLCPCVPTDRAKPDVPDYGLAPVNQVMEKVLMEIDAHERVEIQRGNRIGIDFDKHGGQMSSLLLIDIQSKRVSFQRSAVGESCSTVCKSKSMRCSNKWFKVLNKCEVLMSMQSRKKDGSYFQTCSSTFYGHDLPGHQSQMDELLLNNDIDNYPTTCGGQGDSTERLCGCVYKYPNSKVTYHTVFNVQSKQYFEWQSRYNKFWHDQVGQPGPITRLLSMGGAWPTDPNPHPVGDHLMQEVPTHIAPQYDYSIDRYVAYNKPLSITHWLQTKKVEEDVIIVTDPDCAYINKVDYAVEEGFPVATQGYYQFKKEDSVEMQIAKHYCKGVCKHFDPIAVPVIVHRNDLEKIAPLWLKYTEMIRKDREGPTKWPIQWNDNRYTVNRIEWVAEMFGYVLAAAHLDIRHEIVDLQMVPSVHKKLRPGVPFLHFHVRIETSTHKFWNKGDDHAGQKFPWPVPAGTDEVTKKMLTCLHDAYEALGETERMKKGEWANYFGEWDNHEALAGRKLLWSGGEGLSDRGLCDSETYNITADALSLQ